jgi:hypothetical protein
VEASGITRRWGMCCNVSQLEADCQIAGHWLPSRNDPALNREATRVALRQGSFEPASEASPTDGGDPRHRKRDSTGYGSNHLVVSNPTPLRQGMALSAINGWALEPSHILTPCMALHRRAQAGERAFGVVGCHDRDNHHITGCPTTSRARTTPNLQKP